MTKPIQAAALAALLLLPAAQAAARKTHKPAPDSAAPPAADALSATPPAATGAGPQTWHTGHFDVTYSPIDGQSVAEYVRWLEIARDRLRSALQFIPILPVPVTFCDSEMQYRLAGGTFETSRAGESPAARQGDSQPGPHTAAGAGTVVRGAIVVLPDRADPVRMASLLTRLYCRFAVRQITGSRTAPWLEDGLAGNFSDGFSPSLAILAPAAQGGGLVPLGAGAVGPGGQPVSKAPSARDPALRQAEAVFAVYYLQQTAGAGSLSNLLNDLGKGQPWENALQDAAKMSAQQFEDGWEGLARSGVRSFVQPGEVQGAWSTPPRLVLGAPRPPAPGQTAHIAIAAGDTTLGLTAQVDALLVAGGDTVVQGTVTSRIAILGGNLRIASSARVAGKITVLGGTLTVDPGATVDGTAEVSALHWDPAQIRSDRANLKVTIDRPIRVDLRLPGQSYILQEGNVEVAANDKLDAALALGGSVTVDGLVTTRAVAIGGDIRLKAAPPENWQAVTTGGQILVNGAPLGPSSILTLTQVPHFKGIMTAPVQAGPDPVPIYLGVGDSAIAAADAYDAVLCVGGNCLVNGTVRGGLVAGGDIAALAGSTLTGQLWVFGGSAKSQQGASTHDLKIQEEDSGAAPDDGQTAVEDRSALQTGAGKQFSLY